MKRICFVIMLVLACSYTASFGQDNKKKKETAKQENTKQEKNDTTLGDHYKELGKDIKGTSEATWDEAKKAGNNAWKETKNATGNVLESIGEWSTKSSKKVKGEKK